jgi:hypothetical protein
MCPVCTVAVAGGIGLSRYFGIDDTISGIWIGGLVSSLTMWTIGFLDKRNIKFKGRKILTFLGYYLIIVLPLFWMDIIGHPYNRLLGIDKLLVGMVFGSLAFFAGAGWYLNLKSKNGKAHFPFQKVMMPIAGLLILSLIFYFVTKK